MSDSFVTPWTIALQVSMSMGFLRQEYLSGLSFLSPGDLPNPAIEPVAPTLAGRFFLPLSHLGSPLKVTPNYKESQLIHTAQQQENK